MIEKMKKIELHLHLDGSVPINILNKISNIDNIMELCTADIDTNLTDYLSKFDLPVRLMQTKENIELVCKGLIEELKKDNVMYAEIRFAPSKHLDKGLSYDEVIECVINSLKNDYVKTNVILCMMRNESIEENLKVINYAEKYLNKGVCAVDLAGDESHYSLGKFVPLFKIMDSKNIPYTIHSGEATIDDLYYLRKILNVRRIGHGINCLNTIMMDYIKNKKICLEVCPMSNIQTLKLKKYSNHPIKKLYENGLNLTINTDNRTVSNITLTEEYKNLKETFNFTKEDFIKMNINAINYSFLNDKEKELLKNDYLKSVNN